MRKTTLSTLLLGLCIGAFTTHAQTPEQRAKIKASYDQEKSRNLQAELKERYEANRKRTLELVQEKGWPLRIEHENGTASVLMGITVDERPIYHMPTNTGSAKTSRVDDIRPGGDTNYDLTGEGMIMGIWEVGEVRTTHIDFWTDLGDNRIEVIDGADFQEPSNGNTHHATHVAGTMIGSGTGDNDALGIAYEANLWAYDAGGDANEIAVAAGEGLLISNHSYGKDSDFVLEWEKGAYSEESYGWDEITYNHPYYQPVVAAGNERVAEVPDGLVGKSTSKNVIVVGAVNEVSNYNPANPEGSVIMSDFSRYGPTDDGRIKPDIVTKGVGVFSCYSDDDTDYEISGGTSMASPGIAGALILLQEHWSNLYEGDGVPYMRAATLKGLMSHTADECGSIDGPDHRFGWGLMNATRAAQVISAHFDPNDNSASIDEKVKANNNNPDEVTVKAQGNGVPLKVSISWTDQQGSTINNGDDDSEIHALVNDLDLRVKLGDDGEEELPWKLSSILSQGAQKADNDVDNIEIVEIPEPVAGAEYTITVIREGFLIGGPQEYTLIVTGMEGTLGISENEFSAGINIYPNPATDVFNIAADASIDTSDATLEMYDIQGRLVKNFDAFTNQINVSDLSAGIYILNIKKDETVATKKLIVE